MRTELVKTTRGLLLYAVLFFALVGPFVSQDFWVHNDARIGEQAGNLALPFGHVEAYHLVRVGRIIGAWLYSQQWALMSSYTDLAAHRLASLLMLAGALILAGLHLTRETRLARLHCGIFLLLLFLLPPYLLNAYYASHVIPGSVNILLVIAGYTLYWHAISCLKEPSAGGGISVRYLLTHRWPQIASTVAVLVVALFIYYPTTALFLVFGVIRLFLGHAERRSRDRWLAAIDGCVFVMAVAIYLAAHSVIWPLVKDQDWYSGRWTDPTYSFSLAFQPTAQLESLSQSIALSLNLWNSVAGVNLGFITCVTILLAAGHRTLRARFETETLRHIAFAAGWTGVVFLLSLAPLLITAKPIPGYRVLFVPMTVVWVTLFWSIIYLDRIFASAARLDFTLVVIAAAVCAYTLVMLGSVVAYERKAISCTERIFLTQDLSRTRLIFFKRGARM